MYLISGAVERSVMRNMGGEKRKIISYSIIFQLNLNKQKKKLDSEIKFLLVDILTLSKVLF